MSLIGLMNMLLGKKTVDRKRKFFPLFVRPGFHCVMRHNAFTVERRQGATIAFHPCLRSLSTLAWSSFKYLNRHFFSIFRLLFYLFFRKTQDLLLFFLSFFSSIVLFYSAIFSRLIFLFYIKILLYLKIIFQFVKILLYYSMYEVIRMHEKREKIMLILYQNL